MKAELLRRFSLLSITILLFTPATFTSQSLIKGVVTEPDSLTPMPFVYVISQRDGHGTISNSEGKFSLVVSPSDTLIVSYVGYLRQRIPLSSLHPDNNGEVVLKMIELPYKLRQVTITAFKWKDYERDYMNDIIDRSRLRTMDYALSPFSALYMQGRTADQETGENFRGPVNGRTGTEETQPRDRCKTHRR
jgi:hypothetical protein